MMNIFVLLAAYFSIVIGESVHDVMFIVVFVHVWEETVYRISVMSIWLEGQHAMFVL